MRAPRAGRVPAPIWRKGRVFTRLHLRASRRCHFARRLRGAEIRHVADRSARDGHPETLCRPAACRLYPERCRRPGRQGRDRPHLSGHRPLPFDWHPGVLLGVGPARRRRRYGHLCPQVAGHEPGDPGFAGDLGRPRCRARRCDQAGRQRNRHAQEPVQLVLQHRVRRVSEGAGLRHRRHRRRDQRQLRPRDLHRRLEQDIQDGGAGGLHHLPFPIRARGNPWAPGSTGRRCATSR